jgi:aspartyl-tRNA(Asn)/glutamyl-tRNA(Gln) amidotransferase subunit C
MSLDNNETLKIADLSKLYISDAQTTALSQDLTKILDLVSQLNKVDTNSIEQLEHPRDETQPLRADNATETNQRDTFQAIAPKTYAGLYIVPKVIDQE